VLLLRLGKVLITKPPVSLFNRRFQVLGKTRMPNLAFRSLTLAIKALPQHWEQAGGYQPVLAETFSDIEQFEGTCCYKASRVFGKIDSQQPHHTRFPLANRLLVNC